MTPREKAVRAAKAFPTRLKLARKSIGVTQDQLAEKAELSTVALSKFESGVNRPTFENLIALTYALDVSLSYLTGMQTSASDELDPKLEANLIQLESAFKDLPSDWIDLIIQIAKKAK